VDNHFEMLINGIVSKNPRAGIDSENMSYAFIQVDKEILKGMEGAPAFSLDGRLMGVMHRVEGQKVITNYGYILPISNLKIFIESQPIFIERKFKRQRGIHEIPFVTPYLIQKLNLKNSKGVLVSFVDQDSLSAKAGLDRYDLIMKINDMEIKNREDFIEAISRYSQDKKWIVQIERSGKLMILDITE
jgi:serine protease Do